MVLLLLCWVWISVSFVILALFHLLFFLEEEQQWFWSRLFFRKDMLVAYVGFIDGCALIIVV